MQDFALWLQAFGVRIRLRTNGTGTGPDQATGYAVAPTRPPHRHRRGIWYRAAAAPPPTSPSPSCATAGR